MDKTIYKPQEYKAMTREALMAAYCSCEGEFVCDRCWAVHDHLVMEKSARDGVLYDN